MLRTVDRGMIFSIKPIYVVLASVKLFLKKFLVNKPNLSSNNKLGNITFILKFRLYIITAIKLKNSRIPGLSLGLLTQALFLELKNLVELRKQTSFVLLFKLIDSHSSRKQVMAGTF